MRLEKIYPDFCGYFRKLVPMLSLLLIAAFAEAKPKLTVEVGPTIGDSVQVNFRVSEFVNITGFQLPIGWNPAVLRLENINNAIFNLAPLPGFEVNSGFQENTGLGQLRVNWYDFSNPASLSNGTILFSVKFKVLNPGGTSTVGFVTIQDFNPEAYDFNGNDIGWDHQPGNFPSGAFTGLKLIAGTLTGSPGDKVCIPITAEGFNDIAAFQFSFGWNPTVLSNPTVENVHSSLTGLDNNPGSAGQMGILWTDPTAEGITLANGTKLFDLCFTIIGATGTFSDIVFTNVPTATDASLGTGEQVAVQTQSGKVTVTSIGPPPCDVNGLTIEVPHQTVGCDDTICIPIRVHNWTGVTGFQASFNWDISALQYIETKNITLKDLGTGNFDVSKLSTGKLGMVWFENEVDGDTLPNGSAIFELCFKVLADDGAQTVVAIGGDPTIIDAVDPDGDPIPVHTCPGTVIVDCTSMSVNVLSKTDPVCPDACTGAITIEVVGGVAPITITWTKDGNPYTPAPSTTVLQNLCPGNYVVSVKDAENTTVNQLITIVNPSGAITVNPTIVGETCAGQGNGSIDLNAAGGNGTLSYTWNPSTAQGENPQNLAAGTYSVTISDGNCSKSFGPYTVPGAPPIVINVVSVTDASGGQDNGAIDISVSGGIGAYTYDWSNDGPENPDNDPQDLSGLAAGVYTVTVTDANGCTKTAQATVNNNSGGPLTISSLVVLDSISCYGQCDGSLQAQASGGSGAITYSWKKDCTGNVISGNILTNLCAGTYCITVTDAAGASVSSQIILAGPFPFAVTIQKTDAIGDPCSGTAFAFTQGGTAPYKYKWSTGATTQDIDDLCVGTYSVEVTDANGCTAFTTIEIIYREHPCYSSRKVITPNNDGKNDLFLIECIESAPNQLSIYNRWGQLVYDVINYKNNWDGKDKNGDQLPDGAYFYVLRVELPTGEEKLYKGDVSIARTLSY